MSNCLKLLDKDGKEHIICRNCEYPEVVSHVKNEHGVTETVLTCTLDFDRWKMQLIKVENKNSNYCRCCGRELPESSEKTECNLCSAVKSADDDKNAKALYKKYSYMLSYTKRVFGKRPKLCVEDEELILFRLGESIYKFDKTEIGSGAYVSAPKKCD